MMRVSLVRPILLLGGDMKTLGLALTNGPSGTLITCETIKLLGKMLDGFGLVISDAVDRGILDYIGAICETCVNDGF
jgi:hypothetical protein